MTNPNQIPSSAGSFTTVKSEVNIYNNTSVNPYSSLLGTSLDNPRELSEVMGVVKPEHTPIGGFDRESNVIGVDVHPLPVKSIQEPRTHIRLQLDRTPLPHDHAARRKSALGNLSVLSTGKTEVVKSLSEVSHNLGNPNGGQAYSHKGRYMPKSMREAFKRIEADYLRQQIEADKDNGTQE